MLTKYCNLFISEREESWNTMFIWGHASGGFAAIDGGICSISLERGGYGLAGWICCKEASKLQAQVGVLVFTVHTFQLQGMANRAPVFSSLCEQVGVATGIGGCQWDREFEKEKWGELGWFRALRTLFFFFFLIF